MSEAHAGIRDEAEMSPMGHEPPKVGQGPNGCKGSNAGIHWAQFLTYAPPT